MFVVRDPEPRSHRGQPRVFGGRGEVQRLLSLGLGCPLEAGQGEAGGPDTLHLAHAAQEEQEVLCPLLGGVSEGFNLDSVNSVHLEKNKLINPVMQ